MSTLASENIRRNGPKRSLLAVSAVVLLLGLGIGGYFVYQHYWQQTPRYALWQMVKAMQTNDIQTLFQFVNLPAVADNLAEQSAGDLERWLPKSLELPDDQVSRLGRNLTKKLAKFLAPKLVVVLEPQIKAAVEKYLSELTTVERAALATLPAQAQIRQEDGTAWVTLTIPNEGQTLRFRMVRPEDGPRWRIVEVNYQDLQALVGRQLSP
ncbi:MAG: DUF2939 domain-containing protein [Desulfobacca sp.]|uniref:DUF2939 domain-containing protein n=1 Tax=Desulfobacca sp. TaxID=2067990 RepID=UPI0040499151